MAASSSQVSCEKYDVFISFRGSETRSGFLSHLIKELHRKPLDVYVDDRLERGEEISSSLLNIIEGSKIALVIFSEEYAYSRWCLEDLVKIMDCKEAGQQIVIPVFYLVDPSDVRHQQCTYAKAFTLHEKTFKDKVEIWRSVLKKATYLAGYDSSKFQNESKFVDAIVEDVLKRACGKYDVFISFRGPDVRFGFLSHLERELRRKHIDVYVDDRLERGEELSSALMNAIEGSKVALVIFSKDYASSKWCLEELVKIMECKEAGKQIVIPVFYLVDPSDVRHKKRTYGEAFTLHEKRSKDSVDNLLIWRSVLKKSADLSGYHSSKFRNESKFIDAIVEDVYKRACGKYDVFINFRGPDVRFGFLSHLEKELHRKNIDVYVDDRLERGEEISSSLVNAIEGSKIALVIFSKDYASSRWCLEELVKIMECKEAGQQIVIPVFYLVDPSNVRHQNGTYEVTFTRHEENFKDKVVIWRSVFKKSANLAGYNSSKFQDDSKLIDAIVGGVLEKLEDISPIVPNSQLIRCR